MVYTRRSGRGNAFICVYLISGNLRELHSCLSKKHWPQNHIHPPIHHPSELRGIIIHGILQSPVFDVNQFVGDIILDEQLKDGLAAHAGEPFVEAAAADGVGVADELDFVFVEEAGDGVEPVGQIGRLEFVDVITATIKIDALPDLVLLGDDGRGRQ